MAQRPAAPKDPLQRYREKRDFEVTSEPPPKQKRSKGGLQFVIQKHWASRLHYDFRLELDGVLLSWAVPKGPSFDPQEKRVAVQTEDHPLDYATFEGTIPPKQYGAGTVIVWDRGTWEPVGDAREGYASGKLLFKLHGEKLAGLWELVRIKPKEGEKQIPWILFKKKDAWARPLAEYDVVTALPDSVNAKPLGPREPAAAAPQGDALAGAVKGPLPQKLSPQLATLSKGPPPAGDWLYEIKFDGYRILARIDKGKVRLFTRNGNDWTERLASLATEVESLGVASAWLDGEVVVLNDDGTPNFNALQNAFDAARTDSIVYFLFDAPFFEGHDLRKVPLYARRDLLRRLLEEKGTDRVRFSESFEGHAASVLKSACALQLEGVIAKRRDATSVSERSETWLKLKCQSRQEFVIGGFSDRSGAPQEVGGLLLGVHDEQGRLLYAGSVGTGWDHETGKDLRRRLAKLEVGAAPFDASAPAKPGRWSKRVEGAEHWVKPQLVAEVSFAEWTPDGRVRHPSFVALRTDKPAKEVRREAAVAPAPSRGSADAVSGVKVSNPERVVDPSSGIKKLDLVRYYESVAEFILPHLQGRPTSLVRAPSGIAGELFFQKHPEKLKIRGLTELDPALWPGHASLLQIDTAEGLVGAAQMNVVEFHTWNALSRNIDKPDRFILDLDPGEGVDWKRLQEAAVLTRSLLEELQLRSWLKTSGGKGLHVVVPIATRYEWEAVKAFSQAVVQHMARVIPQRFVAKSGGANRVGKIFIDYLRNGHGQTTACAYSARSRPGMGVSMPVAWEDLGKLKSGAQWTVLTAREYLSFQRSDPWRDYWLARQPLTQAARALGVSVGKAAKSR